jgi:hypothetical protein
MTYLVSISRDVAEHIDATEATFDTSGGVQFHQLVIDDDKPNAPYLMLVKAFASGNWRTVVDQNLQGKKRVEYRR